MKNMAKIENGVVVDVSVWDGESEWEGSRERVEIPATSEAGVGWEYSDGEFLDVRPPPVAIDPPDAALRESAFQKLMAGKPLTEDEARIITRA